MVGDHQRRAAELRGECRDLSPEERVVQVDDVEAAQPPGQRRQQRGIARADQRTQPVNDDAVDRLVRRRAGQGRGEDMRLVATPCQLASIVEADGARPAVVRGECGGDEGDLQRPQIPLGRARCPGAQRADPTP